MLKDDANKREMAQVWSLLPISRYVLLTEGSLRLGFLQHEPGQGVFWGSQHHRLPDHQPGKHHRPAVPAALGAAG